jgi:hypothetical protein
MLTLVTITGPFYVSRLMTNIQALNNKYKKCKFILLASLAQYLKRNIRVVPKFFYVDITFYF